MPVEFLAVFSVIEFNKAFKHIPKDIKEIINKSSYTNTEELSAFLKEAIYCASDYCSFDDYVSENAKIFKKSQKILKELNTKHKISEQLGDLSVINFVIYLFLTYKSLLILSLKQKETKFKKEYLKSINNILKLIVTECLKDININDTLEVQRTLNIINEDMDKYITMMLN